MIREGSFFVEQDGHANRITGTYISFHDDRWLNSDVIILCVKAYHIDSILDKLRKVSNNSIVITVQNGFGSFETVSSIIGKERTAQLVLNHGVYSDGLIAKWVGGSISYLGFSKTSVNNYILKIVVEDLKLLNIKIVDEIEPYRWLKLAVNSAINPITAILGAKNGIILENLWIRKIAEETVNEIKKLAQTLMITMPNDPLKEMVNIVETTKNNYSSMLIDLKRNGKTEIDYINGYVIKLGDEIGLDLKINKILYYLVKSLEKGEKNEQ
ncbi:MAG: ketopantoate reductase family protein [Thermoprotei archaeon]